MKGIVLVVALVTLSGCANTSVKQILGNAAGHAAGSQVGYGAQQCFNVKNQCVEGIYEEWKTSDNEEGCSCKKL